MVPDTIFEGVHCTLKLRRPRRGVIVVTLIGTDVGELGRAPFESLEQDLAMGPIELFIDAREARAASVAVTGDWALFFRTHRERIRHVHTLTTTKFLHVSAALIRDFSLLEGRMDVLTDPAEFSRRLGDRILAD